MEELSSDLKKTIKWQPDDLDTLSRYPIRLQKLREEMLETRKIIENNESDRLNRKKLGTLSPSEAKAISDVIAGLKHLEQQILKDIHNVQESWRKASERFIKDVNKHRETSKRKRRSNVEYKLARNLKKPRAGVWVAAKPSDIGKQCVVVGEKKSTIGKGFLKNVSFQAKLVGMVEFIIKDASVLNFESNLFKTGAEKELLETGKLTNSFPLQNILVEKDFQANESDTEQSNYSQANESDTERNSTSEVECDFDQDPDHWNTINEDAALEHSYSTPDLNLSDHCYKTETSLVIDVNKVIETSYMENYIKYFKLKSNQFTVGDRNPEIGSSSCMGICFKIASEYFVNHLVHSDIDSVITKYVDVMEEMTLLWDLKNLGVVSFQDLKNRALTDGDFETFHVEALSFVHDLFWHRNHKDVITELAKEYTGDKRAFFFTTQDEKSFVVLVDRERYVAFDSHLHYNIDDHDFESSVKIRGAAVAVSKSSCISLESFLLDVFTKFTTEIRGKISFGQITIVIPEDEILFDGSEPVPDVGEVVTVEPQVI